MIFNTNTSRSVAQNAILILLFTGLFTLFTSCRCSEPASHEALPKSEKSTRTVNLAIWPNFISTKTIERFQTETGIQVQLTHYATNEEVLAKIQAGATGYDVIVPSDYMVVAMSKLGLLEDLDQTKIPNMQNIDPTQLKRSFDPENRHSLPYAWSYSGIAVNRQIYNEPVVSWSDLFHNQKLKGRIGYTDDARETLGSALKMLGFSLNSQNIQEVEAAKQALIKSKMTHQSVVSDDYDSLIRGDIVIAHFYSSDALQASKRGGGRIEFVIPKEGGSLSTEHVVILKNAPHQEEAYQLINFLMTEQSNKELVTQTFAGPVIKGVQDQMIKEVGQVSPVFPTPEQLKKYEVLEDLGEFTAVYEQKWTEFKAAN